MNNTIYLSALHSPVNFFRCSKKTSHVLLFVLTQLLKANLLWFVLVYSYSKPLTILNTYLLVQRLCNELIEKQANPTFKTRLANALHSLTNSNQLSSTLDRINCRRFRKNLLNFLIEVRGFLRVVWCNLPSLQKGLFLAFEAFLWWKNRSFSSVATNIVYWWFSRIWYVK